MAGQKVIFGKTEVGIGSVGGFPLRRIIENGNVEKGDEWALLRLTDEGLPFWREGSEFRAGIIGLEIAGKPAVVEISRHKSEELAIEALGKLSEEEQQRTLVRSVRPK